jgi:uncharacterized protein
MKILPYSMLGQLTLEVAVLSAVLLPAAIAANAVGIYLVRRVSMTLFYRILYALLFLLSLKLVVDGLPSVSSLFHTAWGGRTP